ncbi:MAG: hypothetical protein KQH63_03450 [Desulfobulbaceae bacterium]|nr:hypothetical protein [Desulfobulbaceae bacterium]
MTNDVEKIEFNRLVALFEQTHTELQRQAARSVDISLVVRNWLLGWYIVEYESSGAERAELYGKKLIERLASTLSSAGTKGVPAANLRKSREFYLAYKGYRIYESTVLGAMFISHQRRTGDRCSRCSRADFFHCRKP